MILKHIKLENIRSYTSEKIEFPEGSTLLCGDIGSGKSTILLAVEFALFGIMKGSVSGASLLRNGTNQGSVELGIELDGRPIIIKRSLKRQKVGIQQDSGYIIHNGSKTEGTAVELKSKIIEYLGYPKEMVSKSKSLIFRYTVYTPQEEMKHILFEDNESRLNTLRKVFGIDKYQRIRENCQIYLKYMREKKKEFEGMIFDLEDKKKQKQGYSEDIENIQKQLIEKQPSLESAKKNVLEKRAAISEIETNIKTSNELKQKISVMAAEINNLAEQSIRNNEDMKQLDLQIKKLKDEIGDNVIKTAEDLSENIDKKQEQIKNSDSFIINLNSKISEFKTQIKNSEIIKERIAEFNDCPTCLQEVSSKHKSVINENEDNNITKFNEEIKKLEQKLTEEKTAKEKLSEEIDLLKKQQSQSDLVKVRMNNLHDAEESLSKKQYLHENLKKMIASKNSAKLELTNQSKEFLDLDSKYSKLKQDLDAALENEKKISVELASMQSKKSNTESILKKLDEEIQKKEDIKKKLAKLAQIHHWLDESFMNLMVVMEKHVMMRVYNEFNDVFQKWFNTLIEDESITVRLDDEFTPVVEQNGYETSIEHLSGGEKTSCALAYRLALNKVINDIISTINTKDLIILDEPTDGFSTEQLDRVRDVLDELNIAQILIVSHESKIESFVNNIIRIHKSEHVSKVLA